MSFTRRATALALAAAAAACGGTNPPPVIRTGPRAPTAVHTPDAPSAPTPTSTAPPASARVRGAARISGIMVTPDSRPLRSAAVILRPLADDATSGTPIRDVDILPDGRFTFRNVPSGHYQIRARGETEGQGEALCATFLVSVEGHDETNVTLILTPGGVLEGAVVIDSAAATRPPLTGVRVRAPFVDGTSFGDTPTGDVAPDGSFRIRGLMTGAHYIRLEGLPAPWLLKTVMYRGRDITDLAIDVQPGDRFQEVRITITDRAGGMSTR